jgi:hypothetical protein
MAAPEGNNFYLKRSKHGRDKLFSTPDTLWEAACEYFKECDDNPWMKKELIKGGNKSGDTIDVEVGRPYTIAGLCIFLDIDTETFRNYAEEESYKDFFRVTAHIKSIIRTQKFEGAAVGLFNPSIIAQDLGLANRHDITSDGKPLKPNVIKFGGVDVEI